MTFSDNAPSRRALLCSIPALALCTAGPTWAAEAASEAQTFIDDMARAAIAIASAPDLAVSERSGRLRGLLERGFDVQVMSRFVLGRYWRDASAAQQQAFVAMFRDFTVATYALRFDSYAGQTLQVVEAREQGGGEGGVKVLVSSRLLRPGGAAIALDWRVRQSRDGWRIYDVVVEGVSMVMAQRSEFAAVIQRNGSNVDDLIEQLRARTARLTAETS